MVAAIAALREAAPAIIDTAVTEVGQPRRFARREIASALDLLGALPALAEAILETLDKSEAARRRAQAGREHVLERHSAARLIRDVDELYRELLAAKKAA